MSVQLYAEGIAEVEHDVGGCALIAEFPIVNGKEEMFSQMFVRVQSWSDNKEHRFLPMMAGKKVRIKIEFEP